MIADPIAERVQINSHKISIEIQYVATESESPLV